MVRRVRFLQNIDRLLGLVGCVTIFGGIDLGVINILVYGEAGAGSQIRNRLLE